MSRSASMSKNVTKLKNEFFASCPGGLEEILLEEVKALEPKEAKLQKGGVQFTALPEIALELLFSSRVASRVYKRIYQFEIKSEKDLYYYAKEIKWKAVFELDQTFKINVVQTKSADGKKRSMYDNSMFLGQKLKDAIVDRFRDDCKGERPSVEKNRPDVSLLLHLEPNINPHSRKEIATILLDLTGRPLSERGYKKGEFTAPLKENLAAGLVKLSGYDGKEPFVDAMCGSGTILIEAMMIAGNIPPCFSNLSWISSDQKFWSLEDQLWYKKSDYLVEQFKLLCEKYQAQTEAGYEYLKKHKPYFLGNDIDQLAIRTCNENLVKAGLGPFVELQNGDALNLETEFDKGVIIINPPYGERLGQDDDLIHLYHEFGETLKHKFKGFRAYVFTGNLPLIKKISLRTTKKIALFNGNIESRLAEYLLY